MSSTWNNNIGFTVFGESHGPAIGVVMDNVPPGESIDLDKIYQFMARRAPKQNKTSTQRKEKDMPQIMSGYFNGKTMGTPLCALIANTDQHSQDYSNLSRLARPGHADYTGALRYRGFNDVRGGGHFSGRLTAPLCFAGAVAGQILEKRGIYVGAHIAEIHGIKDKAFDPINTTKDMIREVREKEFPTIIDVQGNEMIKEIDKARKDKVAEMTGSENNDEFYVNDKGHVVTKTNNHGGILGGIASGMPITLRVAFKPTPSIARPQATVDYSAMKNETLEVKGRHDPCVVPRAVPCVEAAVNIALLNHMLEYPNF